MIKWAFWENFERMGEVQQKAFFFREKEIIFSILLYKSFIKSYSKSAENLRIEKL